MVYIRLNTYFVREFSRILKCFFKAGEKMAVEMETIAVIFFVLMGCGVGSLLIDKKINFANKVQEIFMKFEKMDRKKTNKTGE
jgi:hypothetical protein